MIFADVVSWVFLVVGAFFCVVGGLGLLRLPDFFSRMHGGGITDTLGASMILVGLMFQGGFTMATVKLVMIWAALLLTSPTATHAIAKAAFASGLRPFLAEKEEGGHG